VNPTTHTTTPHLPPPAPPAHVEAPSVAASKASALEILRQGVHDLLTSDGWRRALAFRQRFHAYSFFNTSLILAQRPDARLVAGYRAWQKSGRQVRRGERGLAILAPLLRRDRDDPDRQVLTGFRTVRVFDVSQTDGEPIPLTPRPTPLLDTHEGLQRLRDHDQRLLAWCASEGITVTFDLWHPHALGAYRARECQIALRPGLSHLQAFKTLVHEVAHHLLHQGPDERHTAELEAESTAFLVCHALGIDASSYSFVYLAGWSDGDLEALLAAGDRASKAATTILTALGCQPERPPLHASGTD
jgi:hypothetical protein